MYQCVICKSGNLKFFEQFGQFARVTSDCKPFQAGGELCICENCGHVQKPQTEQFLTDIKAIYENYTSYYQSGGLEQKTWFQDKHAMAARSEILASTLKKLEVLDKQGKFLDIGCGVGTMLTQFNEFFPQWRLFGTEYNNSNEASLRKISSFDQLYTVDLDQIDEHFECISFIHSLEHMLDPSKVLKQANQLCSNSGILLLQVPDFTVNKYDLLIADHLSHFTKELLVYLVEQAGFEVVFASNELIKKEITLVAKKNAYVRHTTLPNNLNTNLNKIEETMQFIQAQYVQLETEISSHSEIVLFGTSIAAVWVTSLFPDKIKCYLDEDEDRVGKFLFSKPILHPASANFERVYFPFSSDLGVSIAGRYPKNIQISIFPK